MSPFAFNFSEALLKNPVTGHQVSPPRMGKHYPFDYDASQRFLRPATGFTEWPEAQTYPNGNGIGCVSGILRTFDAVVWAGLIARLPAGPLIDAVPADPVRYIGQVEFPTLPQIGSPEAAALATSASIG